MITQNFFYEYSKNIKYLKARNPYLDLQEDDDQISELGLNPIQLFPVRENIPNHP
jgi:hypothetical protein